MDEVIAPIQYRHNEFYGRVVALELERMSLGHKDISGQDMQSCPKDSPKTRNWVNILSLVSVL